MSDTPRTNGEFLYLLDDSMNEVATVTVDFARQLERELEATREQVSSRNKRLAEMARELEQERQDRKQADLDTIRALGERNDARAEVAEWKSVASNQAALHDESERELSAERALADRLAGMVEALPAYIKATGKFDEALAAWKDQRKNQTETKHKPCPRCGSSAVADDYDTLTTSQLGIDRQGGAVNCTEDDCEYEGPWVHAVGNETDEINAMVWAAWDADYERARQLWVANNQPDDDQL